jgi:DNA-binding transcriptional regulator YiaG
MAAKKPAAVVADPLAFRTKLGLNQSQFWGQIGVTQSGGSRYESGRKIPGPIAKLLTIAYGTETQRAALVESLTYKKA